MYLGDRIILDPYRGINCWSPHWPLLGLLSAKFNRIEAPWKTDRAYTLGVL
jgi:hypothetical protein